MAAGYEYGTVKVNSHNSRKYLVGMAAGYEYGTVKR